MASKAMRRRSAFGTAFGIYEPAEDTYLLQNCMKAEPRSKGNVLDMGTGSGYLAISALQNGCKSVIGADINPKAIRYAKDVSKEKLAGKNITAQFVESDLFKFMLDIRRGSALEMQLRKQDYRFDLVMFNAPYLPTEKKYSDRALDGGITGDEILKIFIREVPMYLSDGGVALVIFSSRTGKLGLDGLRSAVSRSNLSLEIVGEEKHFFEVLYCAKLKRVNGCAVWDRQIQEASAKLGVRNAAYITKGHRGLVGKGIFQNKLVAIKIRNPSSTRNSILQEQHSLKAVNNLGIGPELISGDETVTIMEYLDGERILEWLVRDDVTEKEIRKVMEDVLNQCRTMDVAGIEKREMGNPYKHIMVRKESSGWVPALLDFERGRSSENPSNVAQFCQFLSSKKVRGLLYNKGILLVADNLRDASRKYKKEMTDASFKEILSLIS